MRKKRILISNDDGIYGLGLRPLIREMRKIGEIVVVVPDGERSAASHSITLHKPFRASTMPVELGHGDIEYVYITNGTPADCVRFGVLEILKKKEIDLIVGGINTGPNLGEDIAYSGTVAIAREAAMMDIPSFAISVADNHQANYDVAAKVAVRVAKRILVQKLPPRVFLNINVPFVKDAKVASIVTRLGRRVYGKVIPSGVDPRGHQYYWLAGEWPRGISEPGTDLAIVRSKKISITPLTVDSTAVAFISELNQRRF